MAPRGKRATALSTITITITITMSDFAAELARLMTARGLGVRELARMVPCNPGHISNLRSGRARPSPELAEALDDRLDAGGTLAALAPAPSPRRQQGTGTWEIAADDEILALDLARRAEVSEVGTGTVKRLELTVDDLAITYPGTPPGELLDRVRIYLGYVGRLLDARMTLAEQRRLLIVGGWMSLLAATTLIDLHRDHAAAAHLRSIGPPGPVAGPDRVGPPRRSGRDRDGGHYLGPRRTVELLACS